MPSSFALSSWLLAAAMMLAPRSTLAAGEAVRLSVHSGEGCPDQSDFVAKVRARTEFDVAPADKPALSFEVWLSRLDEEAEARLQLSTFDGSGRQRRIVAPSCEEAASAMAFIVAVAIDRGGLDDEESAAAEEPAGAAPAAPAKPAAEPIPPTEPPQRIAPAPMDRGSDRRRERSDTRWLSVGMRAAFIGGAAPTVLIAPSPFIELHSFTRALPDPAVRVAFQRASSGVIESPLGSAELTLTSGRLELCPFRVPLDRWLGLRSCATLDAGVIYGRGLQVDTTKYRTRPWVAPGVDLELDAAIVGPLKLELGAGLTFPLIRDEFAIDPGATLYQAPIVGGAAGAGISVAIL